MRASLHLRGIALGKEKHSRLSPQPIPRSDRSHERGKFRIFHTFNDRSFLFAISTIPLTDSKKYRAYKGVKLFPADIPDTAQSAKSYDRIKKSMQGDLKE